LRGLASRSSFVALRPAVSTNAASGSFIVNGREVIKSLTEQGVADATFGRAAKLVAVYLKVMVVLSPAGDCDLALVAHPPIERTELQKLAAEVGVDSTHKRFWKTVNWTQLTEENYYSLIGQLRALIPPTDPFWTLEQYWNVADDS